MKKLFTFVTSLFLLFAITGCSSSDSSDSLLSGQFIDSNVAGLSYETSSGLKGITDSKGRYDYNKGDRVSFKLGDLLIGSCRASNYVTPIDIFPGDLEAAVNLAQLLQSIDSDGDPSNGITPDEDAVRILSQISALDFESSAFDDILRDNLPPALRFVDEGEAETHMNESFVELGIEPTTKYEQIFVGGDTQNGFELWKTDGSLENTQLIKELDPISTESSDPRDYIRFGDNILFKASDGVHGLELWISDGSEEGTRMLKDINEGRADSNPRYFAVVGETCFFQAVDSANGSELWKTDGTQAGTILVKDIRPGTEADIFDGKEAPSRVLILPSTTALSSYPQYLVNLNGLLLFNAYTDENGWELWRSDGTSEGTVIVKDIVEGSSSFLPLDFHIVSDLLLFKPNSGNGLWVTDGTAVGTKEILGFSNQYTYIYSSVILNSKLYFAVRDVDTLSAAVLWQSDGTVEGTIIVKDLIPGYDGININYPTAAGDKFYFQARENTMNSDWVLWVSDGTADGTKVLKNSNNENLISPYKFTALGDTIYFSARASSNTYGVELWKSDGTSAGTQLVKDIYVDGTSGSYPEYLNSVGDNIYFRANDGTETALWVTDGTTEGTKILHAMNYSYPDDYIALAEKVLFSFNADKKGEELWISDGTTVGTTLLKDINQVSTSSLELDTEFVKIGDKRYFVKYEILERGTPSLWVTDGTTAGTLSLGNYNDIYLHSSVEFDGKLVILVGNSDDYTLKITDGTVEGTLDIATYDSAEEGIVSIGDKFFFTAYDSSLGDTLHMSDGTVNGTGVFRGPNDDTYYDARYLTTVEDKLFFSYYVNNTGAYRMYVTDGTAAGTTILIDENSTISFSDFTASNGVLYFSASENYTNTASLAPSRAAVAPVMGINHGNELWRSDGTVEGTYLLKNIANDDAGIASSYPEDLTNVNGTLYFKARNSVYGEELWRSDGTESGTVLVKDIREGDAGSSPTMIASVENELYFKAYTGNDYELFMTDAETDFTGLVDLNVTAGTYNMRYSVSKDASLPAREGYLLLWLDMYDVSNHKVLKIITGSKSQTLQDVIIGSGGKI